MEVAMATGLKKNGLGGVEIHFGTLIVTFIYIIQTKLDISMFQYKML